MYIDDIIEILVNQNIFKELAFQNEMLVTAVLELFNKLCYN